MSFAFHAFRLSRQVDNRRPVLQLEAGDCRWPIGEPSSRGFRFCCSPTKAGRSYCEQHLQASRSGPGRSGMAGGDRRVPDGLRQPLDEVA